MINWTPNYRVRIWKKDGKYKPIKNHPSRQARQEEIEEINRWLDLLYGQSSSSGSDSNTGGKTNDE